MVNQSTAKIRWTCPFNYIETIVKKRVDMFNPEKKHHILGGGFSNVFYFHPYLGKIPILTTIFQMGVETTNQIFYQWTPQT